MTIGSGAEKCQATWFERPKTKRAQHHSKVSFALQNVQRDSYGLAALDRAENPVCCHHLRKQRNYLREFLLDSLARHREGGFEQRL